MAQVEKLLIFLASPGDVPRERRYVQEVVDDLNRTLASQKEIIFQVVTWENNAFPGYGMDAQALINTQIAEMAEYILFVGIMWNRLGTPTPRAASGTVEEFERAAAAQEQHGQPNIWFYFRQAPAKLDTVEQLEQRKKVLEFRKRVEAKGLPWSYKSPSDFRDNFRDHMMQWLSSPDRGAPAVAITGPQREIHELLYSWASSLRGKKEVVRQVQEFLFQKGYYQSGIDGIPGINTKKALTRFQREHGLFADGLIGPQVLSKIAEDSPLTKRPQLLQKRGDEPVHGETDTWMGVEWEAKFLAYGGPVEGLRLIEDAIFQQSMADALVSVGFVPRLSNPNKLSHHAEKGSHVIYLTDRKTWRQRIVSGRQILVARRDLT